MKLVMKLLIVDDSNSVRQRISRLISDPRLPPIEIVGMARNGEVALRMFNETHPDLVTMDLTMPEMDGVECTGVMSRINPNALILVVSAISDKATAIRALQRGAQGFLYKPFTDEQLISALLELTSGDTV